MASLYEAFASIKDEREFESFLRDLCTPAEISAMLERWSIAQLLSDGEMSQRAIAEETGASIATVTRVARFLNIEPYGGYRSVLSNFHA
jgi:TrpR-related protein YerC/YecD